MNLGQIVKDERIKKGISQQALATKAEVTKRAIAYWESGQRQMTVESADKVLKALGLSVVLGAR